MKTVVLLAGHNRIKYGAEANGVKEYFLSQAVIRAVLYCMRNRIDIKVINFRLNSLKDKIKQVNQIKPDLAIELHWNAFHNSIVSGSEAFYYSNDMIYAAEYCNIFEQVSGISTRGEKPDHLSQHSRLAWCRDIQYPSILVENEFLTYKRFDKRFYYYISVTAMIRFLNTFSYKGGQKDGVLESTVARSRWFGYPPEIYHFTGKYSRQEQGGYNTALRNKRVVYVPIYKNDTEKIKMLIDMTQLKKDKPKQNNSNAI